MSQVFISYKGEEEKWAARLADTLDEFGVKVWRDHAAKNGLRLAEEWKPQIEAAIQQSSDMIVLWSEKLKNDATSVAHREIVAMEMRIKNAGGRFIPVILDWTPIDKYEPLSPFQAESSLGDLYNTYGADGANDIPAPEWYSAVLRILAFFDIEEVVQVQYVVGAMTRKQASELQADPEKFAEDLAAYDAICTLRQQTLPFEAEHYGDEPDDWRPFPHLSELKDHTVGKLIYEYDRSKRKYLIDNNKKPQWVLVSHSSKLLSEDAKIREAAQAALSKKCLVVLDPMSLLHRGVYRKLVTTWGLQGRANAFVIGLASCAYQMHADFSKAMPEVAQGMVGLLEVAYRKFASPFEPQDQCILEVGHQHQFARWLQVGADSIIAAAQSPLKFGTMHPAKRSQITPAAAKAPGAGVIAMQAPGE